MEHGGLWWLVTEDRSVSVNIAHVCYSMMHAHTHTHGVSVAARWQKHEPAAETLHHLSVIRRLI